MIGALALFAVAAMIQPITAQSDQDVQEVIKKFEEGDPGMQAWFKEAFGLWFLKHRNDLLAREWVRRGWAEYVLKPTGSSELKETHRVRPECVEKVDAWLQDEID